ncbi:MAG: hydrogenase [Ghiorsea sp.]|nr:hydrogenase [Ghiorsea sp.]MDQ7057536.1 hydrogenase [Ghiorsea sp.]
MYTPLIDEMIEKHGYPVLTEESLQAFQEEHKNVVLFFTENANNYPESNDVAIILPEILKSFEKVLTPAVISRESERPLQRKYRFKGYPALVFLRDGEYVGTISKVRDWLEYIDEFKTMLATTPTPPPAFDLDNVCPGSAPAKV